MQKEPHARSWIDFTNLIFGGLLFGLPWVLGNPSAAVEWNAWIVGSVVAFNAAFAIAGFAAWEEWTNLGLGAWAAITPWLFGFAGNLGATASFVVVGCVVASLAGAQLWVVGQRPGLMR